MGPVRRGRLCLHGAGDPAGSDCPAERLVSQSVRLLYYESNSALWNRWTAGGMQGPSRSDDRRSENPDEAAAQIGELVLRIARHLRANSARRLAPFGLTDGDARALRIIGRARSPLRMSEIAQRSRIVPRSATTIVERLEAKGLVVREIDPADRRSILVCMTDAGSRLFLEIGRARDDAATELFGRLKPAERAELLDLLARIDSADDAGSAVSHEHLPAASPKRERRR